MNSQELRNSNLIVSFLKDKKEDYAKVYKSYSKIKGHVYIYDAMTNDGMVSFVVCGCC